VIFDKNEKRARTLELQDSIKNAQKIKELRSKSDWYIRYRSKGKYHDEKCPDRYQTKQGAENYYKIVAGNTVTKTHLIPTVRKITISVMCDFFIEYRTKKAERSGKKGGLSAAKTICNIISEEIGKFTFDQCREDPMLLQDWIDNLPDNHPEWSSKYIWNICKELKAVFSRWIEKKLLQTPNPMDAVEIPEQGTNVIQYVPTQEDYEKIITTGLIEGVRLDVLRLIGAVRYTGFRINEVLGWQCEDCVLNPDDGGLPYLWVTISKQKQTVRVPRPIRAELVPILREQINCRSEGPVWPWENPPYKLLKVNGSWLYDLAKVEVPRPFHDFRKTVKLELKRILADSKKARDYQGHKSESMDDWYTWYQREDLEEAVRDSYRKDFK
jgi:integrase